MSALLVIVPGRSMMDDAVFHLLVAETGECLASHLCSSASFAKGDLYFNRPERIQEYSERFGAVDVQFIDDTDINEDDLVEKNHAFHDAQVKEAPK